MTADIRTDLPHSYRAANYHNAIKFTPSRHLIYDLPTFPGPLPCTRLCMIVCMFLTLIKTNWLLNARAF